MNRETDFSDLLGKTLTRVYVDRSNDVITFEADKEYQLQHPQDCCERVVIEEVVGDIADLIHSPILFAEESSNSDDPPPQEDRAYGDTYTWTFYRIGTIKGTVVFRWFGESNGYYSEEVDFVEVLK